MCFVSNSLVDDQTLNIFDVFSVSLACPIKLLGCTHFHRSQEFLTDGRKTLTGLSQVGTRHIVCKFSRSRKTVEM